MTVSKLCERYRLDLEKGLILGKGDRLKKPSTISTDIGRIDRHILPLLGNRRVKDLTTRDINRAMKDIMHGKTRVSVKTSKLRGRSIVRGGAGTAARTIGLFGGILTYAVGLGVIDRNPAALASVNTDYLEQSSKMLVRKKNTKLPRRLSDCSR
ncbi:MAG: hypothetical protein WBA51_00710 [Erythrobacter sp.]